MFQRSLRTSLTFGQTRILAAIVLFLPAATALLFAHSDGPRPRLTGGFGEETCIRCHKSFPINEGRLRGGRFEVEGIPADYEAGRTYRLTVQISQPGQTRWRFQLTARSQVMGRQAGDLYPADDSVQVKPADGIQYAEHREVGTRQGTADGPVEFQIDWTAPEAKTGPVIFNASGNAADDSWDPDGDYIYTAGAYSRPAGVLPSDPVKVPQERTSPNLRLTSESLLVHLPVPVGRRHRQSEILIGHRFITSLSDAGPGDAFGIDNGANILLGYSYGLTGRLSAGISRARFDQVVTFSGTVEIATGESSPWSVSLVGGVEGEGNFHRHHSGFLQLPVATDFRQLRVYAVPTLVINSRDEQDLAFLPKPVKPEENHTVALGLGTDLALNRRFSLVLEAVPRLAGFGGFGARHPALAGAVKIRSWGHVFTISVASSRFFSPSQYAVNTERGLSLGFNIHRTLN